MYEKSFSTSLIDRNIRQLHLATGLAEMEENCLLLEGQKEMAPEAVAKWIKSWILGGMVSLSNAG